MGVLGATVFLCKIEIVFMICKNSLYPQNNLQKMAIPKEYFTNKEKWEIGVANQINGTFTSISLSVLPELVGLPQAK